MKTYLLNQGFAAAYNCNAYGAGSYNENGANCTTTAQSGQQPAASGNLAYTGESLFLVAGLAVVIVVSSVIAIVKTVKKSA